MWRLETQLRGNLSRPDFLYEATRVYLMLGNAGPLDASLVREWMKLDWQTAYPGLGYAPLREALLQHLDALLAEPLPQMQLDGELVAAARGRIATVPLAQRVYSRIRPSAAAQRLPEWRPSDALGPAGVPLFVRASGKPLTDGIPGFFTVDGFHKVLLPSLAGATKSVVSESWVLGDRVAFDPNGPQMQRAGARRRRALRGGLRAGLGPDAGGPERGAASQPVAGGAGPLHPGLARVADAQPAGVHQPAIDAVGAAWGRAEGRRAGSIRRTARSFASRRCSARRSPPARRPPLLPGHEIDERYKALRDLVGHGPAAPIDLVLREVGDAQQQIAKLAATLVSTGARGIDVRRHRPAAGAEGRCGAPAAAARPLAYRARGERHRASQRRPAPAIGDDLQRQRRAGRTVPGGGERPLSVRADRDGRCAARRLRAAVRAGRRARWLREHAAAALCRYVGQDVAADLGRCRNGAGVGRRSRAVPARRGDPRRVLRRRRNAAALPAGHHAGQRRCGDAAGDARSGWY